MVDLTIFSSAGCGKCVTTKAHLKKRGIPFTEVRADLNPAVADFLRKAAEHDPEAKLTSLPVVMVFRREDDEVPDYFSDYHPDIIEDLVVSGLSVAA